jgi:hypothetical protein
MPRTNNNLEGYNLKLKTHVSIAHPDIYRAIEKLKVKEVDAGVKYYKALKGEKAPPRIKLYVINDALLVSYKQMLLDQDISLETYAKYLVKTFDFSKLEKKIKDAEADDDDSDAESVSDSSSSDDSLIIDY